MKWFTIMEAPDYEINEEYDVRYRNSGEYIQHRTNGKGTDFRFVVLNAFGKWIHRSVKVLLENARKYENQGDNCDGTLGEGNGGANLRSQYRRKS
jgi:hypothetical protein